LPVIESISFAFGGGVVDASIVANVMFAARAARFDEPV
jgi:hypothetical protein